jgi:hypothetical protein
MDVLTCTFYGHLVHFVGNLLSFSILICYTKNNLATLIGSTFLICPSNPISPGECHFSVLWDSEIGFPKQVLYPGMIFYS